MTPRFAFFGTPPFAATILRGLLNADWTPSLVVTEPAKPAGRGLSSTPSAVSRVANQADLPVATPERAGEIAALLRPLTLDLVIVAAYGKLIPAEALALAQHGFVNVHASLLPRWRGASPIQAAILAGDAETGLSYMVMEPTLDTGPVIDTVRIPLAEVETAETLTKTLAVRAAQTIVPALASYLSHPSDLTYQDESQATYAPKLTKADGEVQLASIDPVELDRKVRALSPWPGVYTTEFKDRLLIRAGRLEHETYVVTELQWEGKRPVSGATFARGYPNVLTLLPQAVKLAAN